MGLAASQARLLTITARKADCEFMSMNLSHQKIALARDMERISSDYQEALTKTKLIYDYYGTGTSKMDLNYDLLMRPSVYNDYYPKLVTDNKNRIILNSQYANAARIAGIPAEGLLGTPSSDIRNRFIEALATENIITPVQAASIESVTYNNLMGNGSTTSITTNTAEVTYTELLEMIQAQTNSAAATGVILGAASPNVVPDSGKPQRFYRLENGNTLAEVTDVTLYELLTNPNDYLIAYESAEGKNDGHNPVATASVMQNAMLEDKYCTSVLTWLQEQFKIVLGGTNANDAALDFAYNAVYDILYPSDKVQDNAKNNVYEATCLKEAGTNAYGDDFRCVNYNGFDKKVAVNSSDNIGMVYSLNRKHGGMSGWFHSQSNDNCTVATDITNIAKVFLTAFVDYMTGFEDGYSYKKGNISDSVLYNGVGKDNFTFTINTGTDVDDGNSHLFANFYDTMFNRICLNGWVENERIDDKEYMAELMKNGMAFISTLSDDGFYYQGNYSTDRTILEVADDEAIARAEAKYNNEKSKLQTKEDTIDLKMKNLDTEISSLTTEYDTTKSIISKTIEKTIKRYEA